MEGVCGEGDTCFYYYTEYIEYSASNPIRDNDIGYENIYSHQLKVLAEPNDTLIVLSGSGNSKNVINAINEAHNIGMKTFSTVSYTHLTLPTNREE